MAAQTPSATWRRRRRPYNASREAHSVNLFRLARRRVVRIALLLATTAGWLAVLASVAADHRVLVVLGAAVVGAANVVLFKLSLEARSAVDASMTDLERAELRHLANRDLLDRLRRDVDELGRAVVKVAQEDPAIEALRIAQLDTARRVARAEQDVQSSRAELARVADADRTGRSRLDDSQRATAEAIAMTRAIVDKLSARIAPTVPASRLARLSETDVERPLLTIAVPSYNRPAQLAEAIASIEREVRGQFDDLVEVRIVDDASTDPETIEVAVEFAERCGFAAVHRQPVNLGIERNVVGAAQPCRGDYVLLFGNDDVMVPGALTTIVTDLQTIGAPLHLYEKSRIAVDGKPFDAVPGSSPVELAPGDTCRFPTLLDAARPQGFFSSFGFISQMVFRRAPFAAVDPSPYLDLTMYTQVFVLVEAFADQPVVYRNRPVAYHRSAPQWHKRGEAIGRREARFMSGGAAKAARYWGTALAAAWQRVLDRIGHDPGFLRDQPEHLMTALPLVAWIVANRTLDPAVDSELEPAVVADAERFLASFNLESIG
jgi:GT2 family glycosyltransferase